MDGIEGDIGEEGFVLVPGDKPHGLAGDGIGQVGGLLHGLPVAQDARIHGLFSL